MSVSTFQERLAGSGVTLGEYRGATTPSTFGDRDAEFRALVGACGLVDMSWQAKLVLSGEDRVRWLNGMVTNNVRDLGPNHGNYSFLLSAQGRIQADLFAYHRGDYLLVTTEHSQVETIKQTFDRYIIMDDVEVGDVSDKLATVALVGPKAADVLASVELDAGSLQPGEIMDIVWRDIGISVVRIALPAVQGFELWFAADHAQKVWEMLAFAGAKPAGSQALELYRIVQGQPRYGVDIRDRDLPQETGQQYALNFSKGCYIGQEIVERVRSRGTVHRTFVGFELESAAAPEKGSKVQSQGKDVGEITSAARAPLAGLDRTLALGYIRREFAKAGTSVQAGEADAVVRDVPFTFASES